jgi:hypothetical protein
MAEDKRANPYPYPTAEEVQAAPGEREVKAARNIMVRHIEGIPKRAYLLGDYDHAPVLKGALDLVGLCYDIVDQIDDLNQSGKLGDKEFRYLIDINAEMVAMLEHHGCPATKTEG